MVKIALYLSGLGLILLSWTIYPRMDGFFTQLAGAAFIFAGIFSNK